MTARLWRGKGFEFVRGRKRCEAFEVVAPSAEKAAFLVNSVAGWLVVKPTEAEQFLKPGRRVPADAVPGVWVRWPGEQQYSLVKVAKRKRGRLPVTPHVLSATERVRESIERLKDAGGHRSTYRWSESAWTGLQRLAADRKVTKSEVLEQLIAEAVDNLGAKRRTGS